VRGAVSDEEEQVNLLDILNVEFRWPTRGDRLFVASNDRTENAEIRTDAVSRTLHMTDGYKNAADLLVEEALRNRIARHDLVYPIIFCYRQFIELSLKAQIADYGSLVGISAPEDDPAMRRDLHNLKLLLRKFRKMCLLFGEHGVETMTVVSKCILEFHRMDPRAFTFRYAVDKKGEMYPIAEDRIDLRRLKDVMEGLGGFFIGCDSALSACASSCCEH
jgi:hypothetical protein